MTAQTTGTWVNYLSKVELPVLAHTLREIRQIMQSQTSSVRDLAQVILRDADLTSQVLKVANTVYYNPGNQVVSTVSRAIALIGFETVKGIAMTSMLIDSLIKSRPRLPLIKSLAHALHCGVQARQILGAEHPGRREEIFIAGMLSSIGELLFWSCRTPESDKLELALEQGKEPLSAQKQILGTTFPQLSVHLANSWHLGDLMVDVVSRRPPRSDLSLQLRVLCELVKSTRENWNENESRILQKRLAAQLQCEEHLLLERLQNNTRQAAELAECYGLRVVLEYLPTYSGTKPRVHKEEGDPTLQLQILRDLTFLLCEQASVNTVLQLVAEGLHRAVGFERVALLMYSPAERCFKPRLMLGDESSGWQTCLLMHANAAETLASTRLAQGVLAGDRRQPDSQKLFEQPNCGSNPHYLLAPLRLGSRVVGLFYVDHRQAGKTITPAQQQAFAHFCQHARLCLEQLKG